MLVALHLMILLWRLGRWQSQSLSHRQMEIRQFREIKQFHIELKNLFGGNKDLEDTTHQLFNENWRDFYEVMRPAVEQTVSGVLLDRFKKTFNYVPATYLIKDFH